LRTTTKKRSSTFLRKKLHPGDLAGGFSELEMTGSITALAHCFVNVGIRCAMSQDRFTSSAIVNVESHSTAKLNSGSIVPVCVNHKHRLNVY